MGAESAFEQVVRRIIEKSIPINITEGTVKSVDKEKRTCDVERDDLPELFDVRLTATLEPGDDVATIFPTQGSKCLVALVEGQPTDAFMLSATDIEEVAVRIDKTALKANKEGITAKVDTSEVSMTASSTSVKAGNSEVTVAKEGLIIKKDESLKTLLTNILDTMMKITVTTPNGPSGTPMNASAMQTLKQSINNIFKG